MKIFGVTGWKNAGKTGLMERLVVEFTARGLTVSTIKHAHHSFDVDQPGRDSYRHRAAGAVEVWLVSGTRTALMHELRGAPEPELDTLLAQLVPVDLVLIEGYKRERHPKIEAYRRDTGNPLIAPGDPTIRAVAADSPADVAESVDCAVMQLDDTRAIADFILRETATGAGEDAALPVSGTPPAPPPLRDDCFAMPAGVDWTPVDEAMAALRAGLHPVVRAQHCALADASGRILAEAAIARRANPPNANSAVDGYGFAHASLGPGDPVLPLVTGRAAAGAPFAGRVPPGHAIRILTGAALPGGVDTVVLEEDTRAGGRQIAFRAGIKPRANTRKAGEDVTTGTEIVPKGRVLTPADLALLAATGIGEVAVFERLRVAVISTGDELIEAAEAPAPGQIFDANRPMLLAQLRAWGIEALDMGRVPDARSALRTALDDAAGRAHVILTSGGASAGDEDHVSAILREAGAMQQWRIALKPGRPLALGLWQGVPVFGLPGNPVAALVCTLIFARPALGLLAGAGWQVPQGFDVPAGFEKVKKAGRREYLRARIRSGRAEVFPSEGSGRISGLSWAEGLVELPDRAATICEGDPVRYIPFSSFAF